MDKSPREIFNLPQHFSAEQLKEAYKSKALSIRTTGNIKDSIEFKILTSYYKILKNELDILEITDKKAPINEHVTINKSSSKFDIKRFNELFAQNRTKEVTDKGYESWLLDKSDVIQDAQMITVNEPEPIESSSIGVSYLGLNNINDYSGDNMSDRSLNFMDLKKAYITPTVTDNLDKFKKRDTFRNIDDLKKQRASIVFEMNEYEKREYEKLQSKKEYEESMRYKRWINEGNEINNNYKNVQKQFEELTRNYNSVS